MLQTIQVSYKATNKIYQANQWLKEIANYDTVAMDFEVAIKYSQEELNSFKLVLESSDSTHLEKVEAQAKLDACALDHPSHCTITHFQVAISESESYVFILDNPKITKRVLNYIVTTTQRQVWHNLTYDGKHIMYHTGLFPINYEDTQIFAKTLINHVDIHKAKTGLKELAGHAYGDWGISPDNFNLSQMYDPKVLLYAATDPCATMWVWNKLLAATEPSSKLTSDTYSPWDQLPACEPKTCDYPEGYFYHNTAKFLVKDTVRIMMNGLGIDLNKVDSMNQNITSTLDQMRSIINTSPVVSEYLSSKQQTLFNKAKSKKEQQIQNKAKTIDFFIKPFKHKDLVHRSYFMHVFSLRQSIAQPSELLPTGVPKWPANLVKKFSSSHPILRKLLEGTLKDSNPIVYEAMNLLAQHKLDMYNSKNEYDDSDLKVPEAEFNPRSSEDKHNLFTGILGLESGVYTEAYEKYLKDYKYYERRGGEPPKEPKNMWSWGRDEIIAVQKAFGEEYQYYNLLQAFVEFSFGDKILTSFVPAFNKYTVNSRLYSNLKLLGAKTARFTSSNPNMLQLPSSKSIYAKPVKKGFVSSPGKLILTADFNALEDRVLASLTLDEGKCALLEDETLDGHCYNALGYYYDAIKSYLQEAEFKDMVREFNKLRDSGHKELKSFRDISKPVTFKLAYGGMPDAHKGGSITEELYDSYHNKLYPGVRNYIDSYVIPTATKNGKLHLGLGFYIYTDNPDADQRTLHNSTCQFWSILSILTINKLHQLIDNNNLSENVAVVSSIYDSIYFEVDDDPQIIKWVNDNLINCMTRDFMPNQRIHNTAESEIGYNWADLHKIPNNAPLEEIIEIRKQLDDN